MITIEYMRSFKLGPYAIFDLTVSVVAVYMLAPLLSRVFRLVHLDIPQISWLFFTLPISVMVHILVGQDTALTKFFLDPTDYFFLKFFIIGLLILGIKGIKIIK